MKDLPEGGRVTADAACGKDEPRPPTGSGALDQKLVGGLGGDMVSDIRSDAQ